jgi:Flp pilus assembly pilin Flp
MKNLIARFVRDEEGQDIIEYGLLAAFISVLAWMTLQNIGQDVSTMFTKVQSATNGASGSGGGS